MAAIQEESPASPITSWRVAIVDDVYAGPTLDAVSGELGEFCADVSAEEGVPEQLVALTSCDFADPNKVTEDIVSALYTNRTQLTGITEKLNALFLKFDQRFEEVKTIESYLSTYGCETKTFHSTDELFSGEPFQLVFLDLLLAKGGDAESQLIAKEIYEKFKAFILLMSNSPANPEQVEGFRRKARLLRGFFEFRAKEQLCDKDRFRAQIESLPRDPKVCHAIHDFVMAIETALGGPIEEPVVPADDADETNTDANPVLPEFMHTLRTLGLHDYALLCEITLRNEGHPLGDYMMRLLGAHLLSRLLANKDVRSAIAALDKLRFTEFLPFGDASSQSFHRMYADATTEIVTGPWEAHPWSKGDVGDAASTASSEPAAAEGSADNEEIEPAPAAIDDKQSKSDIEILDLLGLTDDARDLPYLQLGDLLIKDEKTYVFAVLSASCELQFVPTHVHEDRERIRDDTVLLLPGLLSPVDSPKVKNALANAGLFEWNEKWYRIDWFDGKLLGVPHCALRTLLQDRGFSHGRRLQLARALEIQQAALSKLSRIGLEVRPPFPRDITVTLFAKQPDLSIAILGAALPQGGLLFHGREPGQRLLVLRQSVFYEFCSRMKQHSEVMAGAEGLDARIKAGVAKAADTFMQGMVGLRLPLDIPKKPEVKGVSAFLVESDGKKQKVEQIAIRVGTFQDVPLVTKDFMFCLSVEEE